MGWAQKRGKEREGWAVPGDMMDRNPLTQPKSRKSVNLLQQSCYQKAADIGMCSHSLRQLVDDQSVASCQEKYLLQVGCQNLLSTDLLKVFEQVVTSLQITSCG